MKKIILSLALLSGVLFTTQVLGEGCFHDAINVVSKPGVISRGANVRNVACMFGSTKIATLTAGTKVRIIGQTAWTKIVMPDGRVGRVGNDFISESSSWAGVPEMPRNHNTNSYCDTTNPTRCPNPSPQGAEPTWYTDNSQSNYTNNTTTTTTTNTNTTNSTTNSLDRLYTVVDSLLVSLSNKMERDYSNNLDGKIQFLETLSNTVGVMTTKLSATYKPVFQYLKDGIDEQLTLAQMEKIMNDL